MLSKGKYQSSLKYCMTKNDAGTFETLSSTRSSSVTFSGSSSSSYQKVFGSHLHHSHSVRLYLLSFFDQVNINRSGIAVTYKVLFSDFLSSKELQHKMRMQNCWTFSSSFLVLTCQAPVAFPHPRFRNALIKYYTIAKEI